MVTDLGAIAAVPAFLPASALLYVGGRYWLGVADRLDGHGPARWRSSLALADRAQRPLLAAAAALTIATVAAWAADWFSSGARIALTIATVSLVLEYVNYFHRQLQHFDHRPDFRRLMRGDGFRPAHLARDLARHRAGR